MSDSQVKNPYKIIILTLKNSTDFLPSTFLSLLSSIEFSTNFSGAINIAPLYDLIVANSQ